MSLRERAQAKESPAATPAGCLPLRPSVLWTPVWVLGKEETEDMPRESFPLTTPHEIPANRAVPSSPFPTQRQCCLALFVLAPRESTGNAQKKQGDMEDLERRDGQEERWWLSHSL